MGIDLQYKSPRRGAEARFTASDTLNPAAQIQLRDLSGFVETRHQLLLLKPGNRNHWINFAVAHHLNKNYDLAVQVRPLYAGDL